MAIERVISHTGIQREQTSKYPLNICGDLLYAVVVDLQITPSRESISGKKGGIIYKPMADNWELEQSIFPELLLPGKGLTSLTKNINLQNPSRHKL